MFKKILSAFVVGAFTAVGGFVARDLYGPIKNKVCKLVERLNKKKEPN